MVSYDTLVDANFQDDTGKVVTVNLKVIDLIYARLLQRIADSLRNNTK